MFCAGHNGVYLRYAERMLPAEATEATKKHGRFTAARRLGFSPLLDQLALTRSIIRAKCVLAQGADDLVAPDAD